MERILALSNRAASSARALRLMLASMGIEVNGRGTDIYIYTHTIPPTLVTLLITRDNDDEKSRS